MIFSTRDEDIYNLRKSGVTYGKIAEKYSISIMRVRQIYSRVREYKEEYDSYPSLKKLLPVLTQNGLIRWFNDKSILDKPDKIITSTNYYELYKKAQLIGKVGANKISQALIELGYLKPDDNWFKK
jgi:hypothetical protein